VHDVKRAKDRIYALTGIDEPRNVCGRRLPCSTADLQYFAQSDKSLRDIQQQTDTNVQVSKVPDIAFETASNALLL
jgi:hypothetical protein